MAHDETATTGSRLAQDAPLRQRSEGVHLVLGFLASIILAVATSYGVLSWAVGRNTQTAAIIGSLAVVIGVSQALYLVPMYYWCRSRGHLRIATGLLLGAAAVLFFDGALVAFAWSLPQLK
jgi:heme/copper-type cytochrome/quinol oxidase subunit 4